MGTLYDGHHGYALLFRILLAVARGGLETAEICAQAQAADAKQTREILNAMRTLRLVRRERINPRERVVTYRWYMGADADINVQTGRPARLRTEVVSFAVLIRAASRCMTATALAHEVGLSKAVLGRQLAMGRRIARCFPIVRWVHQAGPPIPVYGFGIGQADVPTPAPKTREARNADYRRRVAIVNGRLPVGTRMAPGSSIFNLAVTTAATQEQTA